MKSFSVNQIIAIWKCKTNDSLVLSGFSLVALGNNQNQKNLPTKTRIFHYTTNEKFNEGYLKNQLQQQNDYGKVINKIPLWLKKLKNQMLNIFRLWQSFEIDAFSILKCTVYHNALQFCPIPWQFFRILLQKNSSNYREGNVLCNRLDCHFYCISWHVNSFAGFKKALLGLEKFHCSSCWFSLSKFVEKHFCR